MVLLRKSFLLIALLSSAQAGKEQKIRTRLLKKDGTKGQRTRTRQEDIRVQSSDKEDIQDSGFQRNVDVQPDVQPDVDVQPAVDVEPDVEVDNEGTKDLTITLKITNLSYQQPFSQMFVMVHNADAIPLFRLGREASVGLQILAENGDPTILAETYAQAEGVFFSGIYTEGAPWAGGSEIFVTIPYRSEYAHLSIASMATNTNDCFVGLNGVKIVPDAVITGPGYDAGTEINDELCLSIPGPACGDSGNERSGEGEGFVHVHRGVFGIGDLAGHLYDWRDPMLRVEMLDPFTEGE